VNVRANTLCKPAKANIGNDGELGLEEKLKRGRYRGELNSAYKKWHDGGRPNDPAHPLLKKLLSEADLFVGRMVARETGKYKKTPLDDHYLKLLESANERDIHRALGQYDPNRQRKSSFTTYLKKAILNNFRDEIRRLKTPTHQAEFLCDFNGDLEAAHLWVDENRDIYARKHVASEDRPLAHWLLDQDPHLTITWRHVLSAFPKYKTEDTAGRALGRVKKALKQFGYVPE
jgi:hypothetical protein